MPNITGTMTIDGGSGIMKKADPPKYSGCFFPGTDEYSYCPGGQQYNHGYNLKFSASKSNSIYGASTTVQPAAYYVYIWRRVS